MAAEFGYDFGAGALASLGSGMLTQAVSPTLSGWFSDSGSGGFLQPDQVVRAVRDGFTFGLEPVLRNMMPRK